MICVMTTGKLLKAWRAKAGLTQEELAEAGGMSRSEINDLEADRSSPSVRKILRAIAAIEKAWAPFPKAENERLARFFLGPAREGTLIVAKETIRLAGPRR